MSVASRSRAFTLLEVALVVFMLAILASGLAMPFATQMTLRRQAETNRLLEDAREAVLGFALANGRLPCPATATSHGRESFEPGTDEREGRCSNFHDGFLPGASLGFSPLDGSGFVRDAWGLESNRVRYAVFGAGQSVAGIPNPLTRANGMQAATLAGLGSAPGYLHLCASGAGVGPSSCGAASNQLTRRAAFVILSLGPNSATTPPPGSDESRNVDGDPVFVSREAGVARDNAFDDQLTWVATSLLAGRLAAAGRLP